MRVEAGRWIREASSPVGSPSGREATVPPPPHYIFFFFIVPWASAEPFEVTLNETSNTSQRRSTSATQQQLRSAALSTCMQQNAD